MPFYRAYDNTRSFPIDVHNPNQVKPTSQAVKPEILLQKWTQWTMTKGTVKNPLPSVPSASIVNSEWSVQILGQIRVLEQTSASAELRMNEFESKLDDTQDRDKQLRSEQTKIRSEYSQLRSSQLRMQNAQDKKLLSSTLFLNRKLTNSRL
jgi:hypothetical protein